MKKYILFSFAGIILAAVAFFSFRNTEETPVIDNTAIQWFTIEEAMAAQKKNPKKLFIDMYTDWCGWCKVMDKQTFTDQEVIKYINENFYAVKFNAEQREPIVFNGRTYQYMPVGRRGVHELAYTLLKKRPSYPAFVILAEDFAELGVLKGFIKPQPFLERLKQKVVL